MGASVGATSPSAGVSYPSTGVSSLSVELAISPSVELAYSPSAELAALNSSSLFSVSLVLSTGKVSLLYSSEVKASKTKAPLVYEFEMTV